MNEYYKINISNNPDRFVLVIIEEYLGRKYGMVLSKSGTLIAGNIDDLLTYYHEKLND